MTPTSRITFCFILLFSNYVFAGSEPASKSKEEQARLELTGIRFKIPTSSFNLYDSSLQAEDNLNLSLWGGVNVRLEAAKIGEHLRDLANEELGVTTMQVRQVIYALRSSQGFRVLFELYCLIRQLVTVTIGVYFPFVAHCSRSKVRVTFSPPLQARFCLHLWRLSVNCRHKNLIIEGSAALEL